MLGGQLQLLAVTACGHRQGSLVLMTVNPPMTVCCHVARRIGYLWAAICVHRLGLLAWSLSSGARKSRCCPRAFGWSKRRPLLPMPVCRHLSFWVQMWPRQALSGAEIESASSKGNLFYH